MESVSPVAAPNHSTSAPAPSTSSGAGAGGVQLKSLLRGQSMDVQMSMLTPGARAPVQRREARGGAASVTTPVQMEGGPPGPAPGAGAPGGPPGVDTSMQIHNTDKVSGGKGPSDADVARYLAAFKARVVAAFNAGKMSDKLDPETKAQQIWDAIYGKLQNDAGINAMTDDGKTVKMASDAYQKAILQISAIAAELASMSSAQFLKAKSFGFWSKKEGRALTEQISELTLETSGIGSVFDGIPTLNKSGMGWDPELWGGLSQAYGQAVAEQVVQGGKTINVCVGAGADRANNIWTEVEKSRVEEVLKDGGVSLASVVHYFAAGADNQKDRNLRANLGEFPSRDAAIDAADADFATRPGAATDSAAPGSAGGNGIPGPAPANAAPPGGATPPGPGGPRP